MAWVTTDTDVACSLTVNKEVNGSPLSGYPKKYSILAAFGQYAAITEEQWHKAGYSEYHERIEAFRAYVENLEVIDTLATQTNEPFRMSTEDPGIIVEP